MESDIHILGAGIGGLAAALALARHGARVTVLEQAPALDEVGAGIQLSPNGVAVLEALGLGAAARARAIKNRAVVLRHGPSGREVLRLDLARRPAAHPYLLLHRADLVALLAEGARAAGVTLRTGCRVGGVAETGCGVRMDLPEGPLEVPFAVAADGLRSTARGLLNGDAPAAFTGQTAWRAVVPADAPESPEAVVEMGPHRHLVHYPLRGGRQVNLVGVLERPEWTAEGWSHRDDPDSFRAAFAGFARDSRRWLERVDEVHVWGLFRHPVARRWHGAALALVGDAAHPTLPFLAQGANLALEDAWVLAEALASHPRAEALAAYQARRVPRVTRAIAMAQANARNYHHANPLKLALGHTALRLAGRAAPGLMLSRFDWLYRHDVTAQAV